MILQCLAQLWICSYGYIIRHQIQLCLLVPWCRNDNGEITFGDTLNTIENKDFKTTFISPIPVGYLICGKC